MEAKSQSALPHWAPSPAALQSPKMTAAQWMRGQLEAKSLFCIRAGKLSKSASPGFPLCIFPRPVNPDETPSEASAVPIPPQPSPIPNPEFIPSKQLATRKISSKKYGVESPFTGKTAKTPHNNIACSRHSHDFNYKSSVKFHLMFHEMFLKRSKHHLINVPFKINFLSQLIMLLSELLLLHLHGNKAKSEKIKTVRDRRHTDPDSAVITCI